MKLCEYCFSERAIKTKDGYKTIKKNKICEMCLEKRKMFHNRIRQIKMRILRNQITELTENDIQLIDHWKFANTKTGNFLKEYSYELRIIEQNRNKTKSK